MKKPLISASILSANFAHLGRDVKAVLEAGVDAIHFDVMDHHFVPNLSFGALVCSALRKDGIQAPIDVHLMVENPEYYFEPFAKAGANCIAFHPETSPDYKKALQTLHDLKIKTGLVFNPDVPVALDKDVLTSLDLILLMSVFPGFGGQAFIPETLDKIKSTRQLIDDNNSQARLGIDGGIKVDNIGAVVNAGADFIIVGSGLFNCDDYTKRVGKLKQPWAD